MTHGLVLMAVCFLSLNAGAYEWKFKDGENAGMVCESADSSLDGRLEGEESYNWSREDDRGWFLTLRRGGMIRIPQDPRLKFRDGFHAAVVFSSNLKDTGAARFQNLFTYGGNQRRGYSVMVGKDGSTLLNLHGLQPEKVVARTGFQSDREYRLDVRVGEGKVQVLVDGQEVHSHACTGRLKYEEDSALLLGGSSSHGFSGNLHYFMIEPYAKPSPPKRAKPSPCVLEYPEGTVIFNDFARFQPSSALGFVKDFSSSLNLWLCRQGTFDRSSRYTLHPPRSIQAPVLRYDLRLKGRYDVYANVRAVATETEFQMRFTGMEDWFTVRTLSVGGKHHNMDILVGRDIPMDGKSLELATCGDCAYISSFKFLPSGDHDTEWRQDPAGSVAREGRLSERKLQKRIREKIDSGYLKERTWVNSGRTGKASARSERRGFMLFQQNWMDFLFRQAKPAHDPDPAELHATAARGEFEPLTLGIHAIRAWKRIALRFRRGFGPGVSARIYHVESLPKRTTNYTGQSEFMIAPQYLEHRNSCSLDAGESSLFWIDLRVDKQAAPGIRKGELLLTADGGCQESVPVTLEIHPFVLQPLRGYDIGFFMALGAATREEVDALVKDQAEHGMTTIMASGLFTLRGSTAEEVSVDFASSRLSWLAESCRRHGLTGNLLVQCDPLAVFGRTALKRLVLEVERHARQQGWPDILWTSHDEVPSHPEVFPDFIANLKTLREAGVKIYADHIWYRTTRPIARQVAEASAHLDTFMLRYNTKNYFYADTWDRISDVCRENGKGLYAYNSNNAVTFAQMAAMRFLGGWFFRSFGQAATGQLIWAFNYPTKSPYTDLDGDCSDWVYDYPALGARRGGPALDYQALREGCDDLRYVQTLEQRIEDARRRGAIQAADRAQAVIDKARNSFDKELFLRKSVFFNSAWDRIWTGKDGRRYASGAFNLPNGWSLEKYDIVRRRIATEIIRLDGGVENR